MNPLRRLRRRLRPLVDRRRVEEEMAEELRFHLEQRAAGYAASGLPLDEARRAAERRFGNRASVEERAREARGWGRLERLAKDLRLALRQLRRNPGFAALAVVTLGLGIGANTAMFNVVQNILLRPLPYADSRSLDRFDRATSQDRHGGFSPADFVALRDAAAASYGAVAAYVRTDVSLAEPGRPAEMAAAVRVTPEFFALLGVTPQVGRDFRAGEDVAGADRVVVLSRRAWLRRFGGRADAIGRVLRVDGEPHRVVGVLPASFNDWRHLGWVDVFRPLPLGPEAANDRSQTSLQVLGRRAPGATPAAVAAWASALGARLARQFPAANAGAAWRAIALDRTVTDESGPAALGMLVGLSGFVLLIACSNLANFLLARTIARAREFAVRGALGASRLQLLRPLGAESLVLALAGGGLALGVTVAFGRYLSLRSTGDNGEMVPMDMDWRVFGWAFAASLVTALVFGAAPALFALRLDLNDTLKSGGRGTAGGRGQRRFRQVLIVGQFALAMVLLAGAGLFIRGLDELNHRRAGWESSRLVTATYQLPAADYPAAADLAAFHRRTLERLQGVHGVASASLASATPFFNWADARKMVVEGAQRPAVGKEPAAVVNAVSPRYFETFGTRLVVGRGFRDADDAAAARVFVVNQTLARTLFGDADPVGRRLEQVDGDRPGSGEIVGVVADTRPVVPDPTPIASQLYVSLAQEPRRRVELAVQAAPGVAPTALVEVLRNAMTELDPDLPLRKLQSADATILRSNYQLGVLRDMLLCFGVLGLGLACIGIYGVLARTMALRTSEFAIRLALGSSVGDVVRLVLRSGATLALAGSALGVAGAYGVARVLAYGFPGMRLDSPAVLAGTTLLLLAVGLLACWLPARRAARIDATAALRAE